MQRTIIKFTTHLMTSSGINLTPSKHTSHSTTCKLIATQILFVLACLSTCMVSLTNTDDFYTFINPSPYVAAGAVLQGGIYFIYHYREPITEMFHQMDRNLYTYPDENLLHVHYPWYLEEGNFTTLMSATKYVMFFILFSICLPVFGELLYYGRIKTFIYPSWMPWEVDSLNAELFKFMFQLSQAFCGIWFTYMITVFQLVVIVEFVRQYNRLTTAVGSLGSRTEALVLQQTSKKKGYYDQAMRQNIIHCIRHHQQLHKNFHPFKIWFSTFFSLELTISAITFAFALFVMLNASSLGQVLNYFIVVFFIWTNLLTRCFVSEIFSSMNHNLSQTLLWEVEWYQTSRPNRRLLLIFHQMACRPFRLCGLSIFEATRITFAKLIRVIYSIFNVLNLSMKK